MADNKKLYLDLAGLQAYDAKIKNYIDTADGVVDGKIAAEVQNRQAADNAINAKIGDTTKLGDLGNTVDAILAVAEVIGNQDDLAKDTVIESINANADAIAAINNAGSGVLATAKAYTDEKVKEVNDVIGNISAFGDSETVASLLVNVNGELGRLDNAITVEKTRAEAAEKTINDNIGAWDEFDSEITITEAISTLGEAFNVDDEFVSMADAVGLINSEKSRAEAAEKALGQRIDAHAAAVDGKVATLVGEDEGKSVRKIANEELAAQLLSGNADADFKTLQELAAWLEDHPESVAEINEDIAELQAAVGQGGSVDAQIDAKINALDSTAAQTAGADGLALNVAIVDGKLTSISGSIAANVYDAHGAAATAETNAKAYADDINSNIGSIDTSEIDKLF